MKKAIFTLLLLFLIAAELHAAEGIIVMPVKMPCDDSLFEHFGTRTANIQILNLSYPEEDLYVFIVKGWHFLPNPEIPNGKTSLKAKGWNLFFEKSIPLYRDGSYLILKPHLLVFPKEIKTIETMGVSIEVSELVSVEIPFEIVNIPFEKPKEAGIFPALYVSELVSVEIPFEIVNIPFEKPKEAGIFPALYEGGNWDFSEKLPVEKMFLVISAGEKTTGGYSFEISEVTLYKRKITVEATLTHPPEGAFVTQVLTYPAVILKLPELSAGEYNLELVIISEQDGVETLESYKSRLILTSP